MKFLKLVFLCAVVGVSAPVFAEGGSDRLIERIDSLHSAATRN
ncbi:MULTISPECIES: co-regulatory protein PtrA N-terminal domain-containing protein [unclassified Pseudomonas]